MGTPSSTKFIKNTSGNLGEEAALISSAGAADAQRVVALNAAGVLDASLVNSTSTSAGVADAGKVVALDASGRMAMTMLPTGIGADTSTLVASEALADGDLVNIWNSAGTFNVRKADATTVGKEAHGFVLAACAASASAVVYFEGSNNHLSSLTPGPQFLSTTAGAVTGTAPTSAGNVVQRVGFATSATVMNFQSFPSITLA